MESGGFFNLLIFVLINQCWNLITVVIFLLIPINHWRMIVTFLHLLINLYPILTNHWKVNVTFLLNNQWWKVYFYVDYLWCKAVVLIIAFKRLALKGRNGERRLLSKSFTWTWLLRDWPYNFQEILKMITDEY